MAIEKMRLVKASGPSSKLNKLITVCCADGNFHPEMAGSYISESMGYVAYSEESPYSQVLQSIKELANEYSFDLTCYEKPSKVTIDDKTQEYIESVGRKLEKLNDENRILNEQLDECTKALEKYQHFQGLNVRLDEIFGCKFISARFGHLSKDGYIKLTKGYSDNPYILFCPCSNDDTGYWGIYFAPTERVEEIDRIFAALHFDRMYVNNAVGTVDEVIEKINENDSIITAQKDELKNEINAVWDAEGEKIRRLYFRLDALETVFSLRRYAVHHQNSAFFVGWIPARDEKKFKERIKKYDEFVVETEKPSKGDKIKPPIKLKNLLFTRPYEYFVKMYGLPSYDGIDITGFVAITYTILFGIMFGDLGQGLVLALIGLYMWKVKKSGLGKILVPCGFSSMIFGCLFGSVFGFEEALDPVYEKIGLSGKPFTVMDSINTVLIVSIAIGVVLVIMAMIINMITKIKDKKIGEALFTENGLAGICIYVGGANLAYGFMADGGLFPTPISIVLLLVGLVIVYCKELLCPLVDEHKFKKPDSVMDFILQNFFECFEYILSYFSNTVSFLRVGAFVIVHVSMMMVVFTLAGDTSSVKGIIVVIIGNIIVIAIEGLLSGIQGLRLEFYEMFSRFYEGDGRPYEAISLTQKIVSRKKSRRIKRLKQPVNN